MKELCRMTCLHSINRIKLLVAQFFVLLPLHFLIERQLLYRILWFSVIHQQESTIGTPMSPSSRTSCPSSSPSYPSRLSHSSCLSSLSHGKFPLAICFTYGILHFHVTLSIHFEGFPGGQSDKESTCQCKRHKR